MIEEKKVMNATEAAAYLSVSRGFLFKLTSAHRVPFCKPCGRRIFFRKSDLDDWLESGRVLTNEELRNKNA